MSKLITTRYEYALYDDAQGVLAPANNVPPTYPPTLDTYAVNTTASAGNSYGTVIFTSVTTATLNVPPGANLIIIAPSSNTTNVYVRSPINVVSTYNAAAASPPFFSLAPGETMSYPGVWIVGTNMPIATPCDATLAQAASGTTFSLTVMWSL